jgi:hypothetical protein
VVGIESRAQNHQNDFLRDLSDLACSAVKALDFV